MNKNKVIKNASWIIGIQLVKSLLSIVISMLTARFLGPSNFGLINYAQSIVTFVSPIMYLGINNILVREIIDAPEKEGETLGTAITMSLLSSVFCIIGVFAFTSLANRKERETVIVCCLYSILLIFQALEMIMYWFQAKLKSKYTSIVALAAYAVVSSYKIFLLATGKSIRWFALSNALDYMLIAVSLLIIYRFIGSQKLSFSSKTAKKLLAIGKYYIISNLMITIFSQTDRIMLKLMIGDSETGFYSAAVTCAGMTGFVFAAIIDSFRPIIFDYKKNDEFHYEKSIISLYSLIIYLSILQSVAFTVLAHIIISILYGSDYFTSIPVLQIIVWYCTFSYLGGARDIWILAENKQKHLLTINAVGAVMNVILNYFLIPPLGARGAALASVITQLFINYIFVLIYKPTRRNGILQIYALNPRNLLLILNTIRKRK